MKICFENDIGSVRFGEGALFKVISLNGFEFLEKTRNITRFSGHDGQYCLGEAVGARVMTIKGDIKNDVRYIKNAIRILAAEGVLKVGMGSTKRCIGAVCTRFELDRRGNSYKTFIAQFTADYPYFSDPDYNNVNIFERTKLISSPFTLPAMLSKRNISTFVDNIGDIKTEPIIEIHTLTSPDSNASIIIENTTSKKSITLDYAPEIGEIITVDIPGRTVTSDRRGTILFSLSNDSFLSDMLLEKGKNAIKVTNSCGAEISVICRYKNRYGECMII